MWIVRIVRPFAALTGADGAGEAGSPETRAVQTVVRVDAAAAGEAQGARSAAAAGSRRVDWKAINVTAWMLAYADEVGDPMPDECLTTALEAIVVRWPPPSLS